MTVTQLSSMIGNRDLAEKWFQPLINAMDRYEISELNDVAAFLANALHESQNLTKLAENLNYSTPSRIHQIWPNRISLEEAVDFCGNPKKLANRVYADRLGNGNEASGDGFKYRGRGIFQLTGRTNYAHYSSLLGVDLITMPDMLLNPNWAANSAAAYWWENNLNGFKYFDETVRAIAGKGMTGAAARSLKYVLCRNILNGE